MTPTRLLLAAVLLPACFVVPAQQGGGGAQPAGGGYAEPGTAAPAGEPAAAGSEAAPAPAPPGPVSVTLRNTCPQTVRLFFGDKPKFGSGRYTTMSSNSVTSYQMQPGDMIWIVDGSDNGISSTSVSEASRNIEITQGCTGMTVR